MMIYLDMIQFVAWVEGVKIWISEYTMLKNYLHVYDYRKDHIDFKFVSIKIYLNQGDYWTIFINCTVDL